MEKPIIIDGSSEPYIRTEDLAKMLNVKPQTIGDWCRRYPDFPHILLPGSIRVRVSEVEAWLEKLKQNGPKSKKGQNE
jgi:predicted DNA-binding transcriptional regulator AlpA